MELRLWTEKAKQEVIQEGETEEDICWGDPAMFSFAGSDIIYIRRPAREPFFPYGVLSHEVLHKVLDTIGESEASQSMDSMVKEESLDWNGWIRLECVRCPYFCNTSIWSGCLNCPVWKVLRNHADGL